MHDYDYDDIIIIIDLKTEMIPITTGATRTTPQPSRTFMKAVLSTVN
jgi:hypothetical protein